MAKISFSVSIFFIASLLVNMDLFFVQSKVDVYYDHDDNWYGIVLQYLENGNCSQGLPISFEFSDRKGFHTCQFFKILNAVSPAENFYAKTLFLKASARIALLFLFFLLGILVFKNGLIGLSLGTWFLLDSGFASYKPLVSNILEIISHTENPLIRSSRYISPLHYILPGIALLYIFLKVLLERKISYLMACVFIVCAYLLSTTPFYVFLPFIYALGSLWMFALYFSEKHVKIILTSFLLTLFALIALYLLPKLDVPFQKDALLRSGFISKNFEPIFIGHKALIFCTLLWIPVIYSLFRGRWIPTLLVSLGPYILLNINLFTGIEYQNFHFNDYLAPIMIFSLLAYMCTISHLRRYVVTICCIGIFVGVVYQVRSQFSLHRETHLNRNYIHNSDILNHIATAHKNKKFFCHELYFYVPLENNNQCLWHHLLMTYPISNEELLHITIAEFYLRGYSPEQVLEVLMQELIHRPIATYSYGSLEDWFGDPSNTKRFTEIERIKDVHKKWTDYYIANREELAASYIKKIDYFIFSNTQMIDTKKFRLVQQFAKYSLYEKSPNF